MLNGLIKVENISEATPKPIVRLVAVLLLLLGVVSNYVMFFPVDGLISEEMKVIILYTTGTLTFAVTSIAALFGVKIKR